MPDDSVLDPQAIDNLRALSPDGGTDFLRELIGIYLQDTPAQMASIEEGLAKQDAVGLTRAAHTIKGSSSNFGAMRLAKVSQEIEAYGKAGNLAAATTACPRLKSEYALVVAELAKLAAGT